MIHRLVPLAVLLTTVVAPLAGFAWKKSMRVDLGGVSFPLLTVVFVLTWAGIAAAVPFARRRAEVRLGTLIVPWLAWLAWAGLGMWRAGVSGGGLAYLAAWAVFPALAVLFARRWPLRERDAWAWVVMLSGLAAVTLVAPRGMLVVPANINLTAMVLLPGFTLAMFFAFERRRALAWLAMLVVGLAFIAATRRSALLSCVVATGLIVATLDLRRKLVMAVLIPLTLAYVGVFTALLFEDFWIAAVDRLASLGLAYDAGVETPDTRRAELTRQAIDVWREHPWLGVGHGRYLHHLRGLGVDEFLLARPHNIVLISLAENGTVGATILVSTLVLPGLFAWRRTEPGSLARAVAATYAACCVFLLGNDYVHSPGFWPVFCALLASAFAEPELESGPEPDLDSAPEAGPSSSRDEPALS